jgi:DNA transformation protein
MKTGELVSTIRNLGPASVTFYGRAGIDSAKDLRDIGADEAYFRALSAGGQAHFIGYYAMVMGLQGRPWNDCQGKEKEALKDRFTAIKARLTGTEKGRSKLEAALNQIGVIDLKSTKR